MHVTPSTDFVDRLRRLAHERSDATALIVHDARGDRRFTYAELDLRARALAAQLQARFSPGERALLLLDNDDHYVVAFFACLYAGLIAVPAFPQQRRQRARLEAIAADCAACCVLVHSAHAQPFGEAPPIVVDLVDPAQAQSWREHYPHPTDIAVLQYTSGSTSAPKGVVLTHANLIANEHAIEKTMAVGVNDVMVSWLPLYHDMGLIGGLLQPVHRGIPVVLMSPKFFLERPLRWLEAISRFRGTISGAPDFAYRLCLERAQEDAQRTLDLSSWRVAFSGAEPVRHDTLQAFVGRFAPVGFSASALYPCYGLAESVLMVSCGGRGTGLHTERYAAAALAQDRVEPDPEGRTLVGCGMSPPGHVIDIVDPAQLTTLPPGRVGEIWASGPSIAQGYWRRPDASADTFVERDGIRWLRTGDLGFVHEGQLYVTGRRKDLIILNGQNLYPQDIESAIEEEIELVRGGRVAAFAVEADGREGVGVAAEIGRSAQKLVAPEVLARAIREAAAEACQEAPLLVALLNPGALPKTSSGKLQRSACRLGLFDQTIDCYYREGLGDAGSPAASPGLPSRQPSTATERQLAEIWAAVLDCTLPQTDGHFFALGGNSIAAVRMLARIRECFDIELDVRDLFETPALGALAAKIDRFDRPVAPPAPDILLVTHGARPDAGFPLSPAQRGLWLTWKLDPESSAYNLPGVLRLRGRLDENALRSSLNALVARHATLRTLVRPSRDDEPMQFIQPASALVLPVTDIRGRDEATQRAMLDRFAALPFALDREPPFRAVLYRLGEDEHWLAMSLHHIAADGWSMSILVDEFVALYEAFAAGRPARLADLPIQFADYATSQRNSLGAGAFDEQLAYWRAQLGDEHPSLELPQDRERLANRTAPEARYRFTLPRAPSEGLRSLARRENATPFMVMLALFKLTLYRYSGQTDLRVGAPIADRQRAETQGLIGYLTNLQVLRTQLDPTESFLRLLGRVRTVLIGALAHKGLPFDMLLEALQPPRRPGVHPLFQVKCTELPPLPDHSSIAGLDVRPEALTGGQAHFDLSLDFRDRDGSIEAEIAYAADLFDEARIAGLARSFRALADHAIRDPELPLASLTLPDALPALWGESMRFPAQTILELWERSVAARADTPAICDGDMTLTYGELDARAERLAAMLSAQKVGPEARVALCAPRGCAFVLGMLAVLKAGGAYVPLDPQLPAERLKDQCEDCGARLLLGVERPAWAATLPFIALESTGEGVPVSYAREKPHPLQAAYVIYTSGSNGRPKGVTITHVALANYVQSVLARLDLREATRFAMVSTVAADLGHTVLFGAFCLGQTLHLVPDECARDADRFAAYMERAGIDVLKIVPSHLEALLQAENPAAALPRRCLVLGGEAASPALLERISALRPNCRIVNHYGPTETTVGVLTQAVDTDAPPSAALPLGRPLPNCKVHVLDAELNPAPQGTVGELCIGGVALARGYLARPAQTAERFIADPDAHGERLYRSGDRVRQLPDGRLEFLGRVDEQVKIRGYRVEPREVASALRTTAGVRDAAVIAHRGADGRIELHAYVVMQTESVFDAARLRTALAALLPDYMLPAALLALDALPLNANGKLDRNALPLPAGGMARPCEAPRGALEQALAAIWTEVLGTARVSRDDNFFELGGDSILSLKIIARARRKGLRFTPKQLFGKPTIRQLAAVLEAPEPERMIPTRPNRDDAPLSYAQSRLWFLWQLEPNSRAYNMPGALRLEGALDHAAMRRTFGAILERHESLRTTFHQNPVGEAVQRVHAPGPFRLDEIDLRGLPSSTREQRAAELAAAEAQAPFDLEVGPLLRARLLTFEEGDYVLLVTMHHIVSDGWSINLLVDEFAQLYTSFSRGEPPALPTLAIQYADYAVWQRRWIEAGEGDRQLAYWKRALGDEHPALELPTDRARPAAQSYAGAEIPFEIGGELTSRLRALAQAHQASLFMVLLAAFKVLLRRWSGQTDIRVGVPVANRNRPELEKLIGFFVNAQVSRALIDGDSRFVEVLAQVRDAALEAQAHQDLPFEHLVEIVNPRRSLGRHPLFQVTHNHRRRAFGALDAVPNLEIREWKVDACITQFDLTLNSIEFADDDRLQTSFIYAVDLFDRATIERMAEQFRCLLRALVENPAETVSGLPLIEADVRAEADARPSARPCLHELFEARAALTPDAIALVADDGRTLRFGDLDRRANRLARRLRRLGVGPDVLVTMSLERSFDMVVAMLAILEAGGAYVPLDPHYPKERLAYMLADSGASLLLIHEATRDVAPAGESLRVLDLDRDDFEDEPDTRLPRLTQPDNLAYCIYTSGSTGQPKAVQISHAAIVNHMEWMRRAFPFAETDRVLQKTAFGFDASVWEFWLPLIAGGRCVLAPPQADRDLDRLWPRLTRHEISVLQLVPSVLRLLLERPDASELLRSVRLLFCGGEALPPQLVRDLRTVWRGRLWNLYGPTEATIDASFWPCGEREDGRNVPIGRPIAETVLHVLDERLSPAPIGVVGELYIGGRGLARGYLRRPGLTAERFVADPFASATGGRLYRTGDLARLRADGTIEYVGRSDQQIKLRGFRVELGEIEARLRETGLVKEAAALAHDDPAGDKRLFAYVVADAQALKARHRREETLDEWQSVFETVYDGGNESSEPDFTGWISSYTGQPIARAEMQEWLDATVERIGATAPRRVLEIGCGSGLILERLAPQCSAYVGTDFSRHAIERLAARLRSRENLRHVELRRQEAASFEGLARNAFDIVVLNSIVQYFPDTDYLLKVLRGAAQRLTPGGRIFIGDVRDLGRLALFHTSVQLAKASADLDAAQIRRRIAQAIANDKELLLAPAFFATLVDELPGLTAVEPELKRGRSDNELTRYRYDVTLHFGGGGASSGAPPAESADLAWNVDLRTLDDLSARLAARGAGLTLRNVPERRLGPDIEARRLLRDAGLDAAASLRERLQNFAGAGEYPEAFRALGEAHGYRALLRPSAEPGCFDADFVAADAAPMAIARRDAVERREDYANDPLLARLRRQLAPELHESLRAMLPDYMLPTQIAVLERMPLTANGKLDRKALLESSLEDVESYEPPQGGIETELATLWAEVLGVARVGRRDDFFARGGHSLAATRLVARLRRGALGGSGVELPLHGVFAHPVLAAQAAWIAERRASRATQPDHGGPAKAPPGAPLPLSPMQRRLWLVERLSGGNVAYNMTSALRLDGALAPSALQESLARLVARHEALRTAYVEDADGTPVAEVRPAVGFDLPLRDLSALDGAERAAAIEAAMREHEEQRFDLRRTPLLRASLLALGVEQHVLLLSVHHIAADGWSVAVLTREFAAIYQALSRGLEPQLAPLPLQYGDYAVWHSGLLTAERRQREAAFWREYLQGAPTRPTLPGDHARPALATHEGDAVRLRLPAGLQERVANLALETSASPYMVLLAAFSLLLHREAANDDVLIGADVAGRNHPDLENLVGFFINLLPLRSRLEPGMRFADLIAQTKSRALAAFEHQDLPFDQIVELLGVERDRGWNPLVQILFVLQNAPRARFDIPGLVIETMPGREQHSKFDMALFVTEDASGYSVEWVYATALFERKTVERLAAAWSALLERALAAPASSLDVLLPPRPPAAKLSKLSKLEAIAAGARKPAPLVRVSRLGNSDFPLTIEPAARDLDPLAWARAQRPFIEEKLNRHAAILFRGFGLDTPQDFEAFAEAVVPDLYGCYGDLPKNESGRRTYHSTPYPEQQMILFHNESSHLASWPRKQLFYCEQPATRGGATPIVDCREVYRRLPPDLAEIFERKQLLYVRTFAERLDVGWREFFKTERREEVEEKLRSCGVEYRWLDRDALQTRTLCPAVITHPETSERVFFNQLQLHHIACLDPGVRDDLVRIFGIDGMPRHVYFGDGSPIDDDIVDLIGRLYEECAVRFPWRRGDVLMLDNMMAAHARDPFEGARRIVVAMGAMFDRAQLDAPAMAASGER